MIIKAFSLVLILISAPPNPSGGKSFISPKSFSLLNENICLSDYSKNLTQSVNTQPNIRFVSEKRISGEKSPWLAFAIASIPIPLNIYGWIYTLEKSQGHQDFFDPDAWRVFSMAVIVSPLSLTLLPISAHTYVGDPFIKTACLTLFKSALWFGTLIAIGSLGNFKMSCIIGNSFIGGVYLYELIDAPLAARRYNEKLKKQQESFYIQPLAWNGEYRLNVGYNF